MAAVSVTTTASQVVVSLDKFQAALVSRSALMQTIALGQLVSVYRTFDDEGSPAGSWAPLAASTLRGKKYTAGHKLLILTGRLRNSIAASSSGNTATVGTNVVYAAPQFLGTTGSKVRAHGRTLTLAHSYERREVTGKDGKSYLVPTAVNSGRHKTFSKSGRKVTVNADLVGPRRQVSFKVAEHDGGIPARNPLVFRPEDPERIREQVQAFVDGAATEAGLAVTQ